MAIRIRFDRILYPERAVQSAAEAFSPVAPLKLESKEDATWVVFDAAPEAPDKDLYDEFCNYVLAECRTSES